MSFSPDGKCLAAGGTNGAVGVWRLSDGKVQWLKQGFHQREVTSISFSPDGKSVISGGADSTIRR